MDAERDLMALEDEMKALKATYPVAASKVRFVVQTSQVFSVRGQREVRIKFTPNHGLGKPSFTTLRASIAIENNETSPIPQVNEPQDGSGEVVIKIKFDQYSATTTYQIKIIASGPSAGSFSML